MPPNSLNQRFPSGPFVIPEGSLPALGSGYSVMTPAGVMRPIRFPKYSVNQRLPSGPFVIPMGPLSAVGIGYSVMTPAGVMRPILFP